MFTTCCCRLKMPPGPTRKAPVPTPNCVFLLHFTYLFFFLSSFPLLSPLCQVQQARADARLRCAGHRRDRLGVPHEPRGRNMQETKGHGRRRRAERTDESWERTGWAQEEGRGSTQEPLRPSWSDGRWRLARCRTHLSPAEHKCALGGSGLP